MPAISNRPHRIVSASIDLGSDFIVNVRFDASLLTPAWIRESKRRDDESDPLSLPKAVADIISDWDVTNEDGSPYPPTPDNLAVFAFGELAQFVERMIEAATPGAAEGNASANISATAAPDSTSSPAIHQNGLAPSPLPTPSASPSPT